MIITYHGSQCFKISQGDITLALNPVSKNSKAKTNRFGADITLITTDLPDYNGREQTSRGDKESFIIDGPGEYETKGIFIKGFLSSAKAGQAHARAGQAQDSSEKINTIYLISFEGINLCFLGALSNPALSEEILEAIEDVDILFLPVGKETLEPAPAYKLAVSLEPSVIIPMNYTAESLKQLLKEGGEEKVTPIDKFVVKKKDLEGKEGELVVLKEE